MATSSNSAEVIPPWVELPREITAVILQKLDVVEIFTAAEKVCRTWRSVCRDPAMWQRIHMRGPHRQYHLDKICCDAVDRSQGQLIELGILDFGSDDLLLHVSHRSPELRRLLVALCDRITDEGMSEAIKNFPLLEELHVYEYDSSVGIATIQSVGPHCPHLKTFKLNRRWSIDNLSQFYDEEALAIAKNMPELVHLQLRGNDVTNEGVQAILEGCPCLESLDLRQCYNVDLKGDLGCLCRQRIKDLKHDYEFGSGHCPEYWEDDMDVIHGCADLDCVYDSDMCYDYD